MNLCHVIMTGFKVVLILLLLHVAGCEFASGRSISIKENHSGPLVVGEKIIVEIQVSISSGRISETKPYSVALKSPESVHLNRNQIQLKLVEKEKSVARFECTLQKKLDADGVSFEAIFDEDGTRLTDLKFEIPIAK